ncbi:MAG TPA: YbjN domain-containing protein [Acidimicrobiales bacterium]|nr:YbjN domain-containing protein [Acidimicrobiales bacterium]
MPLIDAVREYFSSEDWPVMETEDGVLETAFEGTTTAWPVRIHVFDEDARVVFISAFPAPVDDDLRSAVGEFCHRANFGLAIGNFELDYDGGEVRFRTSIDVEGSTADQAMVRNVMVANVLTMDRYVPGLLAVLAGSDPADAIEDVEEAPEPDDSAD